MKHTESPPFQHSAEPRLRRAELPDVPALTDIETLAFASDWLTRRSLRALVQSSSATVLLAELGSVAGYAVVLFRKGSGAARLYSLAVRPGSRGRGIGLLLLEAAERAALDRGADRLRLEVRSDNAGAIRLYEGHGYVVFGRREGYYADGAAALRMTRELTAKSRTVPPIARGEPLAAAADG